MSIDEVPVTCKGERSGPYLGKKKNPTLKVGFLFLVGAEGLEPPTLSV